MLENNSQGNSLKSAFFSRPPQYPLEINSVYRPKFSKLMTDKPFTKPFYAREDRRSAEKISLATKSDGSIPSTGKCSAADQKFSSSIECNAKLSSLTSGGESKDSDDGEKVKDTSDGDKGIDVSVDSRPPANVQGLTGGRSALLNENEDLFELFSQNCASLVETDKSYAPPTNDSTVSQIPDAGRPCVTNNVTLSLMELPSSVYVPPSYPVPPVILSNSVTAFSSASLESLVTPMLTPQVFLQGQQQQQHRKPFSMSKNRNLSSMPSVFHENGLYGADVSQNGTNKEYYVMVHVEAGATFSIRTGDQEQQIPGPATVRLVLNNGPPLPMPMQVPPGHLVQQIVDEDGVLTHVILSPIAPYSPHKAVSSGPTSGGAPALTLPSLSSASGSFSGSDPAPRLPAWPSRLRASGGVNVIISPKTSPGLAVAGPTWPTHGRPGDMPLMQPSSPSPHQQQMQHKTTTDALSPPHETVACLLEQRRKLKQERRVGGKRETLEETPDKSLLAPASASSTPGRPKKQSAAGKKKVTASSGAEGDSNKSKARKSRKALSVEAKAPVLLVTPEEVSKTELTCHKGGQVGETEARRAPSQPKVSALLRDDYSSLTFDETDGKAAVESASYESNGAASVDTNLSQRIAKPVNVVRPTNGGRPLSAMNKDLTPAEACKLKASIGRLNGRLLDPSLSPTASPPLQVASRPDNVWTARKLAALGGYAEASAATTTAATTITPGKPDRGGEKSEDIPSSSITTTPTKSSNVTTDTASRKQGTSEKRKKTSKNGEVSKQKGNAESSSGDKKTPKKDQQQNSGAKTLAFATTPNANAAVTTTLDITETASALLPNATQHPYYSAPPFYAAGTSHHSSFFPAPPHAHFGPPPPPCFIPPPPPPHFQQTHHSAQPLPPYLFSPGNPAAVVAGTPYLSFQLPPPPITHGLPGPLHPIAGSMCHGTPLLGVPHALPFVTPSTAGAATIGIAEDERTAIVRALSRIAPPKISSVDCRSVTINISIPENLCIGEQPPNSTEDVRKPPSGVISKKEGKSTGAVNEDRDEDTTEVRSTTQESSTSTVDDTRTPSTLKSWVLPPSDLRFALYLAERNENFVCVYVGEVTCILLQDLRPGVQYTIKVCCMYEGLCGTASESIEFVTLASKPSCPRPPNVFARTKSTLSVRWAVPVDNGAKITSYCLQYATITKGGGTPSFQICYTGSQRFHKLSHLLPATTYMLRVAAINAHGQSPWSDVVSVMTYGLPPSSPDPPRLLRSTTHSLHLTWDLQPTSHGSTSAPFKPILRYQLEMQEGEARQHFKKVFDDDATQYLVEGLRRCCLYRFRLAASNVDGISHWSDIVAFRTAPDLPSAPKGLRLRGRVRPFHVNLCWLAPDDDGGMPVSAYRLEIFMPQLPTSILLKHATHQQQQHKKEGSHRLHPTDDSEEIKSPEICGPVCWPWVIASSDNNAFACVPPSIYILQPPTSSIYSLGKVNDVPQLPFRVPSSADPINNLGEEFNAAVTSPLCLSESSDNETTDSTCAWYAIYEGRCREVTVYNLTPGQSFQFRVRASSHRTSLAGQLHSRNTSSFSLIPWGHASTSPLKVTTPVVPPINSPSNLRLFGHPKPTELNFTWDPPTSNGGAPILSYELWQSLCDPISGNPINTTSWSKTPPSVMGITSSESMRDLHAKVEPIPPFSSSMATTGAVEVLSAPGSVTSSPLHQTSIATHAHLVFAGVENSCDVRGLHPGQLFAFRLRARNSTGWSDWSEWSTFATAPSPPSALGAPPRVKPTSAISVLVSWEEVEQINGAPIIEYRVEWQPNVAEPSQTCTPSGRGHDEEILPLTSEPNNAPRSRNPSSCSPSIEISKCLDDGFQLVYSGLERQFELHDLKPASRIAFRVRAVNIAGAGEWSPVGGCVMPAARPDQPFGLALDSSLALATPVIPAGPEAEVFVGGVSMTTARLVWVAPFDNGCPITSYNLEVTRCTNGQTTAPALPTRTNHSYTEYLPLSVDGEDLLQAKATEPLPQLLPSLPPPHYSSSEEEAATGVEGGGGAEGGRKLDNVDCSDLRDVFSIPGSSGPMLQSSSSASVSPSPFPSLGIDSGSGLSSNVSSESGHHCHQRHLHAGISKPLGLRVRHPSGAIDSMEQVRYTLTGLEIGAKYRVRVQALNAVGVSPFSGILHFSTLPPLPSPLTLCCIGTTASGIKLRWSSSVDSQETDETHQKLKPSASANIKYILEMSKKPESKGWVTIFEGPQTSFKARKLSEATIYYFRVAAVNISGKGAFSEVLQEKTTYSQPPPVEAPQAVDVSHTRCKLQWPALNNMGQDPLLYLVQLTRVPGISVTTAIAKTASTSFPLTESEAVTTAGVVTEAWEGEEEAVTVYRGAETSCTINDLVSGTNYIARVCAIRCCQTEPPEQQPLPTSKTKVNQEPIAMQAPLPASSSNSTCAKIMLIHGPFSVGTVFTTLPEKRMFVGEFINSVLLRPILVNCRATLPSSLAQSTQEKAPSPPPRRAHLLANHVNHLIVLFQRLRAYPLFRRISGHSTTSSRERAQRRMACLFVIGFVLLTLLCAWFANQFLLKFSDDVPPAIKWPSGGGPLEDSSSSARAALYATRGRQHHQ